MRLAQPKFAVRFVGSPFGKAVALLDLLLKEIGCFTHFAITVTKSPASRAAKRRYLFRCARFCLYSEAKRYTIASVELHPVQCTRVMPQHKFKLG
jgi:hypothetical protein